MLAVTPRMIFPDGILRVMKNLQKCEKHVIFSFFIIERVFIRGIRRKNKKVKTVFASIPIRKYTFSKNKNVNSLKPQVQRLMKTVDF